MDKEIVITITDREAYYLAQATAWMRGTRKLFGVTKLGDKIYDQLSKSVTVQRAAELNAEWSDAKGKAPKEGQNPPKIAKMKRTMCNIHWIPFPCTLCKAQPHGKKFMKKIKTTRMNRIRLDTVAERARAHLLDKAAQETRISEI